MSTSSSINPERSDVVESKRGGIKDKTSEAVLNAFAHIKEFYTDSQKAHSMLKDSKVLLDNGDFHGALGL